MIKMDVVLSDGKTISLQEEETQSLKQDFIVPASGRFVMAKHDFWCYEINNYRPRPEAWQTDVPETVHLITKGADGRKVDFLPLTVDLQRYYLQTIMMANTSLSETQAIQILLELTRTSVCFTDDGNSWDEFGGRRFDIADKNMDNPKQIAWKISITTAGNVFKRKYGNVIEAIDPYNLPSDPKEHYSKEPWKYFWCSQASWRTTGRTVVLGGKSRPEYECPPFPQMQPVDVLVPLMGFGGVTSFMESWRVLPIDAGTLYSPFVLPDGWNWWK